MKICPQCNTELNSDQISSCPACGYSFAANGSPSASDPVDDDLEFEVQEKTEDNRDLVGGSESSKAPVDDDDLGIEGPEAILGSDLPEDQHRRSKSDLPPDPDFSPIGQSAPFLPEPDELPPLPSAEPTDFSGLQSDSEPEQGATDPNGIKRLSDEELKAIENNLYHSDPYLTDSDKRELMDKLNSRDDQLFTATPIVPKKKTDTPEITPERASELESEIDETLPSPKMANRGKGIAFFYKNIIQLKGSQHLAVEDEMLVAGRLYELRPKTIDRRVLLGGGGALFVLLLFIVGSMFISNPAGDGQIAGIILDENDQPFLQGATISLPDLGLKYESNAEGMFVTEPIPSGSHRVELIWNDQTWASDYATIVDGKISMIALKPSEDGPYAAAEEEPPVQAAAQPAASPTPPAPKQQAPVKAADKTRPAPEKTTASKPKSTEPARLTLAANVDGARISLDGNVLGAGNLTYSKIKPGTYAYEVVKDGYQPVTGKVTLKAGSKRTLDVALSPVAQAQKQEEYTPDDFYFSGLSALQERDYKAAVADLSESVRRDPGNAEAQFSLGQAYAGTKAWSKAHDAFLRAAEVFQVGKEFNRSITAYNEAITADDKSIPAYLGRGNLFLARGEERAALIDFETVVRIDKRNPDAYIGLGRARFEQGLYDKASKHFRDARSIDSDNPMIYQYLMLCYMGESDFDEVQKTYEKFAEIASEQEVSRFRSDARYSAVVRVIDTRH